MAVVSPDLVLKHVEASPLLAKAYRMLEEDFEVQELLRMSNVMVVSRLRYNDHGVTHARIVAGAGLEILDVLYKQGITPTSLRDRTVASYDEAKLIVLLASYLHDIGNSVHRVGHERCSAILAKPILDRILPKLVPRERVIAVRQEVLHAIYAHDYDVECLTIEAGVVKVADGTDMAEGRARIPYRLGKVDIHSVSALSIRRVEVGVGEERPLRIRVYMDESAGIFQVEEVLGRKIRTSGELKKLVEVEAYVKDKLIKCLAVA